MTREAMQQAIDALESVLYEVEEKWFDSYDLKKAIASLRKALSQPSPEWHDMPTCAGVWICDEASDLKYEWRVQSVTWPLHSLLLGEGERWYGPIPEDKPLGPAGRPARQSANTSRPSWRPGSTGSPRWPF